MKRFFTLLLPIIFILIHCKSADGQTYKWAKNMGGGSDDNGTSIAVDAAGNVYTLGAYYGTADFDPSNAVFNLTSTGLGDAYISKLNANGDFVWAKKIGGPGYTVGNSIALDLAGNIYVGGRFKGIIDVDPDTSVHNLAAISILDDAFLAKYDTSGGLLWAKQFGAVGADHINSIALDSAANIYAIGEFYGTVDFNPSADSLILSTLGQIDVFILKIDSAGNLSWAKNIGGSSYDYGNAISVDKAANIYITGAYSTTTDFNPNQGIYNLTAVGNTDVFVSKLDADGNFSWAHSFGGIEEDLGYAIAVDEAANVFVTGNYRASVDFNTGIDTLYKTSHGAEDIFIFKCDSSGNFKWANTYGGTSYDYGYSLVTDASGNIYTTGTFNGTVDFNADTMNDNLTSNGGHDLFILKLDSIGNNIWSNSIGGPSFDWGQAITIASGNKLFLTGWFKSTTDFDIGNNINNLVSTGGYDAYVLKMLQCAPTQAYSTVSACNNYISPSGNYVWTSSGIYSDTIPNAGECDSIITIDLTIQNITSTSIAVSACNNYLVPSGSQLINTSGFYTDTLVSQFGCDSLVIIDLTILNSIIASISATACHSYMSPSGNYAWQISGTYNDTLINALGCDSIIEINLIVNQVDVTVIDNVTELAANLSGASYQWLDCNNGFSPIIGDTNQVFTPALNGNYAVTISSLGCSDTSACNTVIVVNHKHPSFTHVEVYPNPVKDQLYINKMPSTCIITIYDAQGKVALKQTSKNNSFNLDVLCNGLYYYSLIDLNANEILKGKLVKE